MVIGNLEGISRAKIGSTVPLEIPPGDTSGVKITSNVSRLIVSPEGREWCGSPSRCVLYMAVGEEHDIPDPVVSEGDTFYGWLVDGPRGFF